MIDSNNHGFETITDLNDYGQVRFEPDLLPDRLIGMNFKRH